MGCNAKIYFVGVFPFCFFDHGAVYHCLCQVIGYETRPDFLQATWYRFNRSHYFKPSNTLMLNFTAIVEDEETHPNREIDSYSCFPVSEAKEQIYKGSLAEKFLLGCFTV